MLPVDPDPREAAGAAEARAVRAALAAVHLPPAVLPGWQALAAAEYAAAVQALQRSVALALAALAGAV